MADKEEKKEENTEEKAKDEHTIFVGNKPPMSYVLAVVTEFKKENTDKVIIKARGRAISRAVDAAEIAPIAQLVQSGYRCPVQLDVFPGKTGS